MRASACCSPRPRAALVSCGGAVSCIVAGATAAATAEAALELAELEAAKWSARSERTALSKLGEQEVAEQGQSHIWLVRTKLRNMYYRSGGTVTHRYTPMAILSYLHLQGFGWQVGRVH